MIDKGENVFKEVFDNLEISRLVYAIRHLRKITETHPYLMFDDELDCIERDYRLMLDYYGQGLEDPQLNDLYEKITSRLYRYTLNLLLSYRVKNVPLFTDISRRSINGSFSNDRIKSELENYVAETAMLSLEPEDARTAKSREINRQHNDFMQSLFCYLVVSRQWNNADAAFFEDLLLSPTIDSADAQMIVSALTLAQLCVQDMKKFATLVNLYLKSGDERIRQKAFVGWAFALSGDIKDEVTVIKILQAALQKPGVLNDIADLQKQIIFCMDAEKDNDVIQKDIMPDIIKNNNLNITRFGITEKEEDPMTEILDPGASERAAEKVEKSFRKMMDMQKAGSDIYFGGFSQMKRFPFFDNIANWFYPFYLEHPGISNVVDTLKAAPLLSAVLRNGPFCDSDKYSFTLALASVISRLPADMHEALNAPESLGQTVSDEEQCQPAYIRRMVLQDMYRFFRLHRQHSQLPNPFDDDHFILISTINHYTPFPPEIIPDLCAFCYKRKKYDVIDKILQSYDVENNAELCYYALLTELENEHDFLSISTLTCSLTNFDPTDKRFVSLCAKAYFEIQDYSASAEYYGRLYFEEPENRMLALRYCAALSMSEQYEKALNLLYKLDIEMPESMPVKRILAWTLLGMKKFDRAEREYERLRNSKKMVPADLLNSGYCQWAQGKNGQAWALFVDYVNELKKRKETPDLLSDFTDDASFLSSLGIDYIDMRIMSDLVCVD